MLSPERIEYYKERLSEENHYPRAIAYYISGGMTVLLDGHHKVTAAATIGQPIRCLVVMHASIQDRKQAVSLNHNRNNVCSNGLQVFDSNEEMVGKTLMVTERKLKQEQHTYWEQKEDSIWGSIPEEYCQSLSVYPNAEFLTERMAIARNKIKTEFDKLICQVDRENDKDRIRHLLNYCKVFPNNKWITNKEREWLETMEKNIWIYGKITSDK